MIDKKSYCIKCESDNIHGFDLRSDYGSIYSINDDVSELEEGYIPYTISGYYCGNCCTTTLLK